MPMTDIFTITLNPAVDLATSVKNVVAGPKLYCGSPRVDPGGGGVNVARAIHKLGGEATALAAVGGAMGDRLLALLAEEGITTHPMRVTGETRHSLAVTDDTTGGQFRFSLPGETAREEEIDTIFQTIASAVTKDCFVVLSGSPLPGIGDDCPARIQRTIAHLTDRLIVDTSRGPLEKLVAEPGAPLLLLRVDQNEAASVAGKEMETVQDSVAFAANLVARGVARMVVTGRGSEGSVLVTSDMRVLCSPPQVTVRSKVGAGDALVGAMTLALSRGDPPDQALRWGVATACATVGTPGTALCELDEAQDLFDKCSLSFV